MSHEQSSQTSQEQTSSKLSRTERVVKWAKRGALAVGLTAAGVVGGHVVAGHEAIAGHAVAAAERHEAEADPAKYYRSEERNDRIKQDAENFAKRIVRNANKHLEQTKFDDIDPSTGKEDGKGLLTTTLKQGNRTYDFSVSAIKEGDGSYKVNTLDTAIKTTYYEPLAGKPGVTQYEGAVFDKHGDERNDGEPTWDAATGGGTKDEAGQGAGGGYESSLRVTEDPNMTPDLMSEAEQLTAQKMDEIMKQAHV